MRRSLTLIVLSAIALLIGCSSSDGIGKDPIDGNWEVHNISGGFAGINDDYQQGTIIWSFDSQNSKLTISNNNATNTIYDGFESGEYSYSIIHIDKRLYLQINGQEFGGVIISLNELVVNQNITSTGSGADGFVILLKK